jgi:type II secretory pathway pseudopilin PulG
VSALAKRKRARGFTYIGVLFAVAFMGVALALIGQVWSTYDRRAKEQQLLFIGAEFQQALGRYYDNSPGAEKTYPPTLDDLLRDRRYPDTRRYLRKVYPDPLTGKTEWGLVRAAGGAITGIYSLAAGVPIKIDNFRDGFQFVGAKRYAEWIFTARTAGAGAGAPPAVSAAAGSADAGAASLSGTLLQPAAEPAPSPTPPLPPLARASGRIDPHQRACATLQRADAFTCATVGALAGADSGARCNDSAQIRLAECLSGSALSELYRADR